MRIKIVITILIIILLVSCSDDRTFKEIKIKENIMIKNTVMGFGTGRSFNPEMAKIKANSNATVNLINQVSGMEFVYTKSNGSVSFKTKSKGTLTNVQEEASYDLGDNKCLLILSSSRKAGDMEFEKTSLLETSYRTDNLEKSLIEKYQIAIKEIIKKKYSDKTSIKGKLYLSEIKVSDYEGKDDFMVELKILIIIQE